MMVGDWLFCGAVWLLGASCARAANDECKPTALGDEIAQQVCSTCHVVARNQKIAPVLKEPTLSFFDIADRPTTTALSLRNFLQTTHWDKTTFPMTMPRLRLNPEQIDAVTCYILNLRQ
jgi:mono/diheme cytochrome c family protein